MYLTVSVCLRQLYSKPYLHNALQSWCRLPACYIHA